MSSPESGGQNAAGQGIDLDEVGRLLAALENDLAQVQSGSKDVQTLRDEVEALRAALQGAGSGDVLAPHLRRVHTTLDDAIETLEAKALVPADYLARIGRMLGM